MWGGELPHPVGKDSAPPSFFPGVGKKKRTHVILQLHPGVELSPSHRIPPYLTHYNTRQLERISPLISCSTFHTMPIGRKKVYLCLIPFPPCLLPPNTTRLKAGILILATLISFPVHTYPLSQTQLQNWPVAHIPPAG